MVAQAIQLLGVGYGIYAGETQAAVGRKGRRQAQEVQRKAEAAALADAKLADEEENRANQRAPDLSVLLSESARPRRSQDSINADRLLLGRPGQLGLA